MEPHVPRRHRRRCENARKPELQGLGDEGREAREKVGNVTKPPRKVEAVGGRPACGAAEKIGLDPEGTSLQAVAAGEYGIGADGPAQLLQGRRRRLFFLEPRRVWVDVFRGCVDGPLRLGSDPENKVGAD